MGEQADLNTTLQGITFINKVKKKRPMKKHSKPKYVKRLSSFEMEYSKLGDKFIPEKKFVDYILVHPEMEADSGNEKCRQKFEKKLLEEGFQIEKETFNGNVYKIIRCSFKRLCVEAERVRLQMPLSKGELKSFAEENCFTNPLYSYLQTDDTIDFVSAPFIMEKIHWFSCYEDPSQFFRPALRSLLTHLILIRLDYRDSQTENDQSENDQSEKDLRGLLYLLKQKVYHDSFILHDDLDELEQKSVESQKSSEDKASSDTKSETLGHIYDSRHTISQRWTVFWKFQPLWKIRNYFGEKIAFYFAWTGLLMTSLWLPSLIGIIIFCYGLNLSVSVSNISGTYNETSTVEQIKRTMNDILFVIRESFDNNITPYFALVICLWGTIFLEGWKRKSCELAHKWDVHNYEFLEPNRPEFNAPKMYEKFMYYPMWNRLFKYMCSGTVVLFMVCLVGASLIAVIVYRVIVSIDYSDNISELEGFVITTIVSSFLNAVSILILGTVYTRLAYKLNCWENHRTKSSFDDALIIKLFAFHFVNSYSSCFYIAFFRDRYLPDGIMGMGSNYQDKCEGSCMSQLSIQVMVLMLTKPIPKFLKDVVTPQVKKVWQQVNIRRSVSSKVNNIENGIGTEEGESKRMALESRIRDDEQKPVLENFTLEEFTEKMIQYGYLMLFAASFPLAPLIALITNFIDVRVDAKRLLWVYRRPIAFISQDIGMWYPILRFINTVGVISNAFLIAFTSHRTENYSIADRLWVVILFEHVVYGVKLFIELVIPDTTAYVKMVRRLNKLKVSERLKNETKDFHNIIPIDSQRFWVDSSGQKTFKEPILEEPPEKRNSYLVEDETSPPMELSHSKSCNLSSQKQQRLKRKSVHATEMLNKMKKGSVADDEDDGDSDSAAAAAATRDRILNRNRPHSLATAGSLPMSVGDQTECNL